MYSIRRIVGNSMKPFLYNGDIIICKKQKTYNTDDVVICRNAHRIIIKRIQSIVDDKVYLVGDNKLASTDSRYFGSVKSSAIIAKYLWRIRLH